ncbi:MAG TPA: sulfite exporter TauE/SafE family protein [Vicinamibacterales bacterium]
MRVTSDLLLGAVAVVAGSLASVTGFGIGSLLTPVLALRAPLKIAVAVVSIPHFAGTAIRFWMLRGKVDRRVLTSFGLASAAGGLTGALLHTRLGSPILSAVFGALLLFVAVMQFTGAADRLRFGGAIAMAAGALSGLLGGLVGNQGGIRSAGLLGFDMRKESFVATATAVGLMVDAARMPVYVATERREMSQLALPMLIAIAGVVLGTVAGARMLRRVPERWFRRVVAFVLAALGALMVWQA